MLVNKKKKKTFKAILKIKKFISWNKSETVIRNKLKVV